LRELVAVLGGQAVGDTRHEGRERGCHCFLKDIIVKSEILLTDLLECCACADDALLLLCGKVRERVEGH
jgi:hypothetical protein